MRTSKHFMSMLIIQASVATVIANHACHTKARDQTLLAMSDNSCGGVYTLPIINHGIEKHHSVIQLGTPPQSFTVGLDTGSPNLWVPGLGCNPHVCGELRKYNSSASTSYRSNGTKFEIEYGPPGNDSSVGAVGFVSQDTLTIAGIEVGRQDFAEIIDGEAVGLSDTDGILGLGFDVAAVNKIVPPFYHMMARHLLNKPVFAFYFGDINNDEGDRSELMLGGINHSHVEDELVTLPVRRFGTWEVAVDKISLGNHSENMNGGGASIDTGMGLLGVPRHVAEILNTNMGAEWDPHDDRYKLTCETRAHLPNLTFTFSLHDFALTPDDYVFEANGECTSAVVAVDFDEHGPSIVLGPIFLRKWYSVFDIGANTISLARAKR